MLGELSSKIVSFCAQIVPNEIANIGYIFSPFQAAEGFFLPIAEQQRGQIFVFPSLADDVKGARRCFNPASSVDRNGSHRVYVACALLYCPFAGKTRLLLGAGGGYDKKGKQ